jgi:hypothetical protein
VELWYSSALLGLLDYMEVRPLYPMERTPGTYWLDGPRSRCGHYKEEKNVLLLSEPNPDPSALCVRFQSPLKILC